MKRLEFARNCFSCKEEWSKILFSDLVTFEKAGLAQALSSTEALSLGASGDGVLADIEAVFQPQFVRRKGQSFIGRIAGRHSLLAERDSLVGMLTSLSCKLQGTSRSCSRRSCCGQARLQCLSMTGLVDGAQPCSLAQMETILTLVP